jgi:selenocysteine lyase/cysteine desulfurase
VTTLKGHFSRFLGGHPGRLHAAAHSHHPWPDVSFEAHQQAWLDAADLMDQKWDRILGEVVPEAMAHVARVLSLPDPATVAFAPNTHDLVTRLLSSLPTPVRVLTTDAEFHSFARQVARLEEDGATVHRVAAEPFPTFPERFTAAARAGHDLVYVSHVFFDSGYVVPDLEALVQAVLDNETVVVVDGYHAFMALPVDLSAVAGRIFYIGGGYKYAMAGEGAAFMHCPPGYVARPLDTGWFAGFEELEAGAVTVRYPTDGGRFAGATFDPSGLYRFNAVQRWLGDLGLDPSRIHNRVRVLQDRFLDAAPPSLGELVPARAEVPDRGNFLTFRTPDAAAIQHRLLDQGVITDHRRDRLRIGLGLYHDDADVDELLARLGA